MQKVEADLKKNLLQVQYLPAQVTPDQMLQVIDKQDFTGKVVASGAPAP